MADEIKLKPCPFCGGEAEIIDDAMGTISRCRRCGAENGNGVYGEDGHKLAVKDWNTRPIEDAFKAENKRFRKALDTICAIYEINGAEWRFDKRLYDVAKEALKGSGERLNILTA